MSDEQQPLQTPQIPPVTTPLPQGQAPKIDPVPHPGQQTR